MKLTQNQLAARLQTNLDLLYLIAGDDIAMLNSTEKQILTQAEQQGYVDKLRLQVDKNFDWPVFFNELYTASLFAERRVIILNFTNANLSESIKARLAEYLAKPLKQQVLLVRTAKLTPAQQNTKWWKLFINAAVTVMVYPLTAQYLRNWIQQQLRQAQLPFTSDIVACLAEQGQGNQLAIQQALEKLTLIQLTQPITLDVVRDCIADSAQYNIYQLADQVLLGNMTEVLSMLSNLKQAAVEPILILWCLLRDIRLLVNLHEQTAQGMAFSQAATKQGVWKSRERIVKKAFNANDKANCMALLQQALQIDQMIKGINNHNVWHALEDLCLKLG